MSVGVGEDVMKAVYIMKAIFRCKQASRYQSPHPTTEMNRRGLNNIVDLKPSRMYR